MIATLPPKPTGLLKLTFVLPRYLYRWHLGWLLGRKCLMITHVGRKSGLKRHTVLEVVHYDHTTRECIVMAAYGVRSDWYRNIQTQPAVEVQVGFQRYKPQQRMLSPEETLAVLKEYERPHPQAFRKGMQFLGHDYDGTPEGLVTLSHSLQGVAFRP